MKRFIFLVLCACLTVCTVATATAQTLTSDKTDYAPGETATLTGAGFAANEAVTLQVLHADGTPSTGADHEPWTVNADESGGFVATWHVCEDDCVGALLRATATGAGGASAFVEFTDSHLCGTGVATVTAVGGSCLAFTAAQAGGPDNWEVVEGGTYSMTITGVTECSGSTITVFVQGTTGNFCFNATGGGGTYTGTFTMPNPACNTYPISYKCDASATCNHPGSVAARGSTSGCSGVHLRASTFGAGCSNPTPDVTCTPSCTPPSITCPPDMNLQCGDSTDPSNTGTATFTNGCGTVTLDHVDAPAGGCTGQDIDRTWTATDANGSTASCVQHIKFVDTTAPVLANLPTGGDLGCNPTTLPSCDPGVTASDNCDQSISVSCTPGAITNVGTCGKSQTFTYSATDDCGNTASEGVTYTWTEDTTDPVLANLPTGGDLGCNPTPPSCSNAVTASDNCDGDVTASVNCTPGAISDVGTCGKSQTFTYSATDACGNSTSQDVTYTWKEDTTAPALANLPEGGDLGCNPATLPSCATDVTATDNCDGEVPVRCDVGEPTGPDCARSQTFTYSAVDACGNPVSETVTYTWKVDTTKPVLANLPTGGELGCNPTPPSCDSGVSAEDECDGSVEVTCEAGPINPGPREEPCRRFQAFTYIAVDACGNEARETVVYYWTEDTTPPEFHGLPTGGPLGCNPTKDRLPTCDRNVTATDACMFARDGRPIPVECIPDKPVRDGCNWSQTFTYRAVDNCKNVAIATVTYTWTEDFTGPVLSNLPAGGDLGCNPTPPSCDEAVTANDACSGPADVSCTSGEIASEGCIRRQTFTYSATDACGNTTSQDVNYSWKEDTTLPVIGNLPAGGDLGCNPATLPSCATDVTASDNCDEGLTVSCGAGDVVADGCMRSQTFTYSATDACGNTGSATVTYTWKVDTTAPVLANLPVGGDLGCNPALLPSCDPGVTANDACDGVVFVTCIAGAVTGAGCDPRSQTFTYSAKDACGNTTSQDVTYTWTVGNITVCKFYDANANGIQDAGEPGVSGWTFTLDGVTVATTGEDGCATFCDVANGSHTVSETLPAKWVNTTGGTSQTVIVASGDCSKRLSFGNLCLGAGGGLTIGFWSNKNGQNLMNDGGTSAPELLDLTANYCLRNATGTDFDPTTYTQYRNWLLNATATNQAYMLSAQLSAMVLNVEAGKVAGSALVQYAPECANAGLGLPLSGFITISDLIAAANASLCTYGSTPSGHPQRAYQECLQRTLHYANNNLNFVQAGPCPLTTSGRTSSGGGTQSN